ncbi:palmitoyl-protein thioesterase ABHD10, mitochondrial-like isoform X2 [Cyprinus carpio]|uniref:palmitoyl-protein hydrolase n=1 Tax=Cyprinus carpio TaxID=7962 RepID=A0A9Q9WCU4_CYPCA|nr:palmitoyl-protein thioesterase ABHD10, mitochondrial-like isoform X2 [Cyprinus carpio]
MADTTEEKPFVFDVLSKRHQRQLLSVRHKTTIQYATRPDLPKLAYRKLNGKSPGVVFLPGFASVMGGQKAEALEEFCKSLGHSYLRFDYSGCGASEGEMGNYNIGAWKKDVLYVLDELVEGPQILVGSSMGGWLMLLAALARPEKTAALVGISTAADHFVTAFNSLPIEVRKSSMSFCKHLNILNIGKLLIIKPVICSKLCTYVNVINATLQEHITSYVSINLFLCAFWNIA